MTNETANKDAIEVMNFIHKKLEERNATFGEALSFMAHVTVNYIANLAIGAELDPHKTVELFIQGIANATKNGVSETSAEAEGEAESKKE